MHIGLCITNRWTVYQSHTCCACLPVRVIDVCLTTCPSDRCVSLQVRCVSLQFTNIMCLATCLSNRCMSLRVRCVSLQFTNIMCLATCLSHRLRLCESDVCLCDSQVLCQYVSGYLCTSPGGVCRGSDT